ncbi:hypothetical protein M011DRAFT_472890 [Sporormia fimetaria CBS 119925]|uniref:Uncharacterized protein n=1 Tax=Sporormia fimetaria CBS 119925 TaxID=1340428 RepID=A0A6A6UX56_9PLEO|nr:hypothetical protein M011DRAFT_472890 [Sporormia fimetaria CBS 119925]
MARSLSEKALLREKAEELVSEKENVQLASEETTGANNFAFEKSPKVCGVVVDKGSKRGFVQVSGGGKGTTRVATGEGAGFEFVAILEGQTCMLYGEPTVLYICPRPE